VISPEILEEYQRVGIALSEQFSPIDIRKILELITIRGKLAEEVSDELKMNQTVHFFAVYWPDKSIYP
jgi:hypothetical protein